MQKYCFFPNKANFLLITSHTEDNGNDAKHMMLVVISLFVFLQKKKAIRRVTTLPV